MALEKLALSPNHQISMNFIKNIKLPKIAQSHPVAFSVAIVLHIIVLIGLLFSNVQRWDKTQQKVKKEFIPKAVTVDLSEIKKEKQRLVDSQKKKQTKLKREERRLREIEDERYKKQREINQLKAKAKKEKQAKKTAEEKAKRAEKKRKKIEEQRKTEAKEFKEEQEKRSLVKQEQLKEEQKRKLAQEDAINELKANYINLIASRVRSKWRYEGAKDDWNCEVHILQDKDGNVEEVDLKSCNVDDESKVKSFRNAIKRAVNKASPLPDAPDKGVFDREIIFHFRVN